MREKGNDEATFREQIAEVLSDFAMVIVEEVADNIDSDLDWEVLVMGRLNGVIRAFRQGDTSAENTYKTGG